MKLLLIPFQNDSYFIVSFARLVTQRTPSLSSYHLLTALHAFLDHVRRLNIVGIICHESLSLARQARAQAF